MRAIKTRLALGALLLFLGAATSFAGSLDDYYLEQFGELKNARLQKALLAVTQQEEEQARCGMPLKHGLRRDWNLLEQTTQKVLAKQLAAPVLAGEATFISSGGRFKVHFATSGADAPPLTDNTGVIGIPDWVETVAQTLDDVAVTYLASGWRLAPTVNNAPYDVYLRNLAPSSLYGQVTVPPNSNFAVPSTGFTNAYSSYMELDNDYLEGIYINANGGPYTAIQSLQISAAHEYHHSIQYGYNFFFDIWYAEATSTWLEDELYDNVNQLYNYIPEWFKHSTLQINLEQSNPVFDSQAYGRWIFNRYLSEKHGSTMIRSAWENIAGLASPGNGADIPMTPVLDTLLTSTYGSSLGDEFFGFAKRVYTREWTTHTTDIARIHPYSPVATYSVYPVNSGVTTAASPSVTLPRYSFAFYRFNPTPGIPSLTITVTKSSGIRTAVFRKSSGIITEIPANTGGNSYTDSAFTSSDELVLLIVNATNADGHNANFSTDGSLAAVGVSIPPPALPSGSSSGCFIATAAYGSYLHPQVRLLRDFRDKHLLTNAPGRLFVSLYYRYSPPLADLIARHTLLRSAARLVLTPLLAAVAHPLPAALALLLITGVSLPASRRLKSAFIKRFVHLTRCSTSQP